MSEAIRDQNHLPVMLGVSSTDSTNPIPVKIDPVTGRLLVDAAGGGGYTNLTQFVDQTAWRLFYSNGSGDVTELALGANGEVLTSQGASAAPTWTAVSGTGTVTSVSIVTANGVSGSVATATTTPAITLVLGAITPSAVQISGLTASELVATDASKNLVSLAVATYPSLTEIAYVKGVTSAIQTQIDTKVTGPVSATDNAIARFDSTTGKLIQNSTATIDDAGGISTTIANGGNSVGLTVTQNDTTNTKNGIQVITTVPANLLNSYPLLVQSNTNSINGAFIASYHNSVSPAVNDCIGGWDVWGKDSAANDEAYAFLNAFIVDPTSGSEDARWTFSVKTAGTMSEVLTVTGSTLEPDVNDGVALGTATLSFSDLFLASGGVVNFNNGNYTLTHSTGLLTASGAFSVGTSNAITAGTIELGAASDTTISRSAAGVIAVEGVVIPSISSTNTLTNKRVTKRVGSTTSSATPTINTDNVDAYHLTAQAVDITSFTTNLSGTPTDFQQLRISVTGTAARAITWGASFANGPVALPTTTVTTTRLDVLLEWDSVTSKWRCMASGSTV